MAFMTNREFAEHEYKRQKQNAYTDALINEVRRLREELTASQRREKAAVEEVCRRCPDGEIIDGLKHYPCNRCKWRGPQEAEKGENNA